jgi:ParB family transcriptional regulator, chromosome partitioning protein
MELRHIPLEQLHISPLNMRHGKKAPDVSDILPSIRARGILQPLLVKPNADGFEVVAGRRRYFSAKAIERERGSFDPVPCALMAEGDDADAIEASLIENVARRDADEIAQFETFAKLIREGKKVEEVAATFGLTPREVEQRLALGNLLPKIRELYRQEQIGSDTLQFLTMATGKQQREWLKLYEDNENVPLGYRLKQWLCGGQSIPTKAALFPLESYKGGIKADLFGEDSYFASAEEFWQLQDTAIAGERNKMLANGWPEVVVLVRGHRFDQWAFEKVAKKDGGKVYVAVSHGGEVEFFQGWLPRKQIKAAQKADRACQKTEASHPAMTQAMENYLELHRNAAVRLALLESPATSLRLLVAHAIASSGNWGVRLEAQRSVSTAIKASTEASSAQKAFEKEAAKAFDALGLPESITGDERTALCFVKLLGMKDAEVLRLASVAMAGTLAVGSLASEVAGSVLEVDAGTHWQPDDTFLDLIRDKATLTAMIAEVAGKDAAKGNAGAKTATLRQVIRDALKGANGRKKAERWLPGWLAFPFRPYGSGTSAQADTGLEAKKLMKKL